MNRVLWYISSHEKNGPLDWFGYIGDEILSGIIMVFDNDQGFNVLYVVYNKIWVDYDPVTSISCFHCSWKGDMACELQNIAI